MRTAKRGRPLNKVRSDSRTLLQKEEHRYGKGEDGNEYFKCWNCGFICKVGRDALGGSVSAVNISYTENTDYTASDSFPDYKWYDITGNGCPFCHTKNWRGDY